MPLKELLSLDRTILVGILNVTPDSFSDGGKFLSLESAITQARKMMREGADIIDIGGESTRPGADFVPAEKELSRVLPVVKALKGEFGDDIIISIDTYKGSVAKEVLALGVEMINTLGGFTLDPSLLQVVTNSDCYIALYHLKGEPKTMQVGEIHYDDLFGEIKTFFEGQISLGSTVGVARDRFIIDPGIGFGKSLDHNLELIKDLAKFNGLHLHIMLGVSRKSHLSQLLARELNLPPLSPMERIEGALAETAIAIQNGAKIIRTHDVFQTKKFIAVLEELS